MKLTKPQKIPLVDLKLGEEEVAAVAAVLRSGWLSMGPKTAEFEQRFQRVLGVRRRLGRGQWHRRPAPGLRVGGA